MFERLGSLTYRFRLAIIASWIAGAVGCVLFAPSLASVGMTDQAAFLPTASESAMARNALERAFPGATAASSATLSFSRDDGLTDADRGYVEAMAAWVTSQDAPAVVRDAVTGVASAETRPELASMLRSEDGMLELLTLNLDVAATSEGADVVVAELRTHLADTAPDGMNAHVTGTAAISSDYLAAIIRGTDSTTTVTIVLVVVILLLIYRAPLAAMVPLVTIGAAFLVSRGVLGVLAAAGWKVSSLLDTFIVVLVFGVGTDYAIFLISRFREEVAHDNWHHASRTTVRRIGAVISASAATVIVGLGSMAFAEFGMIQTMGPALAVAILVTLVAGLTLTPALLGVFGHYLFWPLHARTRPEDDPGGLFARLASAVSRRPGIVTVALLIALGIPATWMGQMQTNFDVLSELPATSDARLGFDQVAAHLGKGKVVQGTGVIDAGAGSDLLSPVSLARLRDVSQALVAADGIATVTSLVSPDGDGVVPDGMRPSKQLAEMANGFAEDDSGSDTAPTSEALLDDEVTDGLDGAAEYLALLGVAFPDVAAGTPYRTATDRLDTARHQVERVRDNAVVPTQLRALSRSMTSPSAAAGGGGSIGIMGDYLEELAAAHPQVRAVEAFRDASAAAARLEDEVSVQVALDLSSALSSLATWVEDNLPDATLFPESLAGTTEAKQFRAEVTATFDALPGDLDALAAVLDGRTDDIFVPVGLSGAAGDDLADAVSAFVTDDRTATRLYLTTQDDPYAQEAFAAVRRAQDVLADAAPGFGATAAAHLGGPTAEFADVQAVLGRDFQRVAVITVLGILVVLVLLLRAVVAPLYLVATVLLSCATALGLSAWLFQSVLDQAGVSFYLPLMVFVLLVALGSDYNIFLMSRVREESEGRPIHEGIRISSGRTGAVITSAGLILAGTFGSMATAPLAVLFQVGVAVAIGVLIDTFVVRSILVPAITTLFDERAWWPFGAHGPAGRMQWPVVISVPEPVGAVAATGSQRRLAAAVALVALVPVVVAGLAVWSLSDPTTNLDRVTAAVVDEDESATIRAADGTEQRIQLGADLAAGLAAGAGTDTFTWVEAADAADARDGLADGRYGAVLTIPSDFSQTIAATRAGAAGGTATGASRAVLRLVTNDATAYLLGPIARSISDTIARSAAGDVSAAYVDDVLLSVANARLRVAGSVEGAAGLATGSADLSSGAGTVSAVAGELVAGLEEMASATGDASDGFDKLAAGIDQLAAGTRKVATGTSHLSSGTLAAADGSEELAAGTGELAAGLEELDARLEPLAAQLEALAAGATGVSDGVDGAVVGLDALANQLLGPLDRTTAGTLGSLAGTVNGLAAGTATDTANVAGLAGEVAADAGALAGTAGDLAASAAAYTERVASLSSDCAALGGSDELCSRLAAIAAEGPTLDAGAAGAADDAHALASAAQTAAQRAGNAAVGAGTVAGYTDPLAQMAQGAEDGIAVATGLASGLYAGLTQPVVEGAPPLQEVAHRIADGTSALATQMPALTGAVSEAADGAGELADGMSAYADGMAELATGAEALASGASLTADGAARVAGRTSEAADGATQLAGAVDDVVDAGRLVQAEADGLADDGQSVADDAERLAGVLEADAAAIPEWSVVDREAMGGIIANPVTVESTRLNALSTTGSGLAPYFMAIALWVGALATYLVLPAFLVPRGRSRRWAGALLGWLAAAVLGVAQAVIMVATLRWGVGIEVARMPELFAMAILVALAAAAVTQAFVAVLGMRGWFLALMFVVLQLTAAGAWFPIETAPAFFRALHPLLPMTYALDGLRTLIAGGTASLVPAVMVHLAWIAGALAVTLAVSAWRSRHMTQEAMPAAA